MCVLVSFVLGEGVKHPPKGLVLRLEGIPLPAEFPVSRSERKLAQLRNEVETAGAAVKPPDAESEFSPLLVGPVHLREPLISEFIQSTHQVPSFS